MADIPAVSDKGKNATVTDTDGHVQAPIGHVPGQAPDRSSESTVRAKEDSFFGPDGFSFAQLEQKIQSSGQQLANESQLRLEGQTRNLVSNNWKTETDQTGASPIEVTPNTPPDQLQIKLARDIKNGEHVAVTQPVDYHFAPVTAQQLQWKQDHPNGPEFGHLVHVQFRAKAEDGNDHKMTVQLMDAKPPYNQSMSERIDLGKGTKDADGYTKYDFYEVVPDSQSGNQLNLKFNFDSQQPAGTIDIRGVNLQEVASAPGINPADVSRAAGDAPAGSTQNRPFAFAADGNQLSAQNVFVPDDVKANAARMYPDDPAKQQESIRQYQQQQALTPEQQKEYLQRMKDMGIDTIHIPIYWSQIEQQPGKTDYASVDHMIDLAKSYGMKVELDPMVWSYCYPSWADKGGNNGSGPSTAASEQEHTQAEIHSHIDDVIQHFGNRADYIVVNEMNSTDLATQRKVDADGRSTVVPIHNGLTDWVAHDGSAVVINTVDQWARDAMKRNGSHAQLLVNDYDVDQQTRASDAIVAGDPNRPDALGIQMHQFNGDYPVLRIAKDLHDRAQTGIPDYISEMTVPTSPAGAYDPARLPPEVRLAVNQDEQYRQSRGLAPLTDEQRQAQVRQAEQLLVMYKLAANNPSTVGVSLWDFTDRNAWNGNTGGVLDANLDPKISYYTLQNFIQHQRQM